MGWFYSHATRRDLIASLVDEASWTLPDGTIRFRKCEAHTCVGNVLWTVMQVEDRDHGAVTPVGRFIGCHLMRPTGKAGDVFRWGSKDLDESAHPFYYSCPLSYLARVPVSSQVWRDGVERYHAERKRDPRLVPGATFELVKGYKPAGRYRVTSVKPLRAWGPAGVYKIKCQAVDRATIQGPGGGA